MDFFESQEHARHHTKLLVIYFALGVTMMIAAIYAVSVALFTGAHVYTSSRAHEEIHPEIVWWNPKLFLGVAAGTLAVIGVGSIFKSFEVARGGSTVATMLGGRLIVPTTTEPNERKLLNVVEEMAIAAGVPVPEVYVMDKEAGINAFAAGHSTRDAVVSVTAGAIKLLTRDELQGVIGHEFSHILNGDMRLNLRLIGIVFGILCLAILGRVLLQVRAGSGRRDRGGGSVAAIALLGLALVAIGWIGVFFGRLIQAAVSRQREFLADASAVQFTRNPGGLSGALQKIGRYSYGSYIQSPQAEQASHMFFGNGVSEPLFGLLATHPPIAERIRAIDPAWDGKFPPLEPEQIEVVQHAALSEFERETTRPGLLGTILGQESVASAAAEPGSIWQKPSPVRVTASSASAARAIVTKVAAPTPAHLRYAEELHGAIPDDLKSAARNSLGASTIMYALLLSDDEQVRRKQLDELASATSASVAQETIRIWPEINSTAVHAKLPLVDLAMPGLRELSPTQYEQFTEATKQLIESDNQIDLFEYVLQKIVHRHLAPHYTDAGPPVVGYYALKPLAPDCAVLLSALARLGPDAPEVVQSAFERGAELLNHAAEVELMLVPAEQCALSDVDVSLTRLAQAVSQIKKNVLEACALTVADDGVITEMEAEMLRAIADTLDCPMPPFIPQQQ
jgi:Zn-dependent protease with chaperone function